MDQGYDADLVLWAKSQARALRDAGHAGTNLPIDWENVAEEIELLGKSQGRELASRIAVILVHLLKLEASPAGDPRSGWQETIVQQRGDIERILADSPKPAADDPHSDRQGVRPGQTDRRTRAGRFWRAGEDGSGWSSLYGRASAGGLVP